MSNPTLDLSDGFSVHLHPSLVIAAHVSLIRKFVYHPDGRRIVPGSEDKIVKVWNVKNGQQEGTSMEHESRIHSLDVTRDGAMIIGGYEDGITKVWDVQSHKLVKE